MLTVAAIVGKQACALGAIDPSLDRLSIGIGMIPCGEVGLIFANIGLTLSVAGQPHECGGRGFATFVDFLTLRSRVVRLSPRGMPPAANIRDLHDRRYLDLRQIALAYLSTA